MVEAVVVVVAVPVVGMIVVEIIPLTTVVLAGEVPQR